MKKKINTLLTAGLLAGVVAIAPVHAQDGSGDSGSGGAESSESDAGGTDTDADTDADGDADVDSDDTPDDAADDIGTPSGGSLGATTTASDITPEQETEIRRIFVQTAPAPVAVDIDVATGVLVPPTVSLQPLPQTVVEVVPSYETYQYFALDDGRIAIVEPTTMEIIQVLEN